MNPRLSAVIALSVALSCGGKPAVTSQSPGERVVLLELFTSQGCSSCPPADRLLSELVRDPDLGKRIVPLSFHVDYWNSLGWSDPFSSSRWTDRQRRYSTSLGVDVYTPQLVVNGRTAMVGSRKSDVRSVIIDESRRAAAVSLSIQRSATTDGTLAVDVEETPVRGDVWVALWESGLSTAVPSGENRGRTLANDRVVRDMRQVSIDPETGRGHVAFELGRTWTREALGVAAFANDSRTGEVLGAVSD